MRSFLTIPFVFALAASTANAQENTSQITPPPALIVAPEPSVEPETSLETLIPHLLRKTQIGYTQGASTYFEVLEAQRTLRGFQSEYLQALVGVQIGETALDAAINGGAAPLENPILLREAAFNESP